MPSPKDRPRMELGTSSASFKTPGLAAITGLRSMAGPALLSRFARRGDISRLQGTPFAALGPPKVSAALQLLMVREMIADKTPIVPSRTSALPLLGRALSGALVGATLFTDAQPPCLRRCTRSALCRRRRPRWGTPQDGRHREAQAPKPTPRPPGRRHRPLRRHTPTTRNPVAVRRKLESAGCD